MQIHTPWPDASVQHSQPRCLGATGQVGFYKQCNLQLFSGPKHLQQLMHPRHIQAEHQGKNELEELKNYWSRSEFLAIL